LLTRANTSKLCVADDSMKQITLKVEHDEETGWLVASWDAPNGGGGITTQGKDLGELQANVRNAVRCHFSMSSRSCIQVRVI